MRIEKCPDKLIFGKHGGGGRRVGKIVFSFWYLEKPLPNNFHCSYKTWSYLKFHFMSLTQLHSINISHNITSYISQTEFINSDYMAFWQFLELCIFYLPSLSTRKTKVLWDVTTSNLFSPWTLTVAIAESSIIPFENTSCNKKAVKIFNSHRMLNLFEVILLVMMFTKFTTLNKSVIISEPLHYLPITNFTALDLCTSTTFQNRIKFHDEIDCADMRCNFINCLMALILQNITL